MRNFIRKIMNKVPKFKQEKTSILHSSQDHHDKRRLNVDNIDMHPGMIIDVTIDKIKDGKGIVRYDDYEVHVGNVTKGETLKVKILKVRKNIAIAQRVGTDKKVIKNFVKQ